jgi:predicted metal-binding protein
VSYNNYSKTLAINEVLVFTSEEESEYLFHELTQHSDVKDLVITAHKIPISHMNGELQST